MLEDCFSFKGCGSAWVVGGDQNPCACVREACESVRKRPRTSQTDRSRSARGSYCRRPENMCFCRCGNDQLSGVVHVGVAILLFVIVFQFEYLPHVLKGVTEIMSVSGSLSPSCLSASHIRDANKHGDRDGHVRVALLVTILVLEFSYLCRMPAVETVERTGFIGVA